MNGVQDIVEEARRLSALIDSGIRTLAAAGEEVAHAEHAYREAKAKAWVMVSGALAKDREAQVDGSTADLRLARDLAESKRQACIEALRARRVQLSALQSILAATRSEMELAR